VIYYLISEYKIFSSSTFSNSNYASFPSFVMDGQLGRVFYTSAVFQSSVENFPWLAIDFGTKWRIQLIEIVPPFQPDARLTFQNIEVQHLTITKITFVK